MKYKKLLTIAIPTYNRSPFLEESLKRICFQLKGYEDLVELLVSDNCSSDNTMHVIKKFQNEGTAIIYNRNSVNRGMDGNFVYCFQNATSKYVWILGDDDYLVEGTLVRILELIKNGEYGLIHLSCAATNVSYGQEVYTDKSKFVGDISFMITFISANIVRTKYVSQIDFDKYLGTYFTLIPVYLTAAVGENENLMIRFQTMEIAADAATNGGYNIFEVFVTNYLNVINEFRGNLGWKWYESEKYRLCRGFLWGWMQKLLLNSNHGLRFKTDGWLNIIFKKYWYEPYLYPMLLVFWFKKIIK